MSDLLEPSDSWESGVHAGFIPVGGIIFGRIVFCIWTYKTRHLLKSSSVVLVR